MRGRLLGTSGALLGLAAGGALLGGCGSSTKTVSAANAPAAAQTSSTAGQASAATTQTGSTPRTTTQSGENGGARAPSTTRTAPEPAFAQQGQQTTAEGASAAAGLVRAHGYTPKDTGEYHPGQTLKVLLAARTGSSGGYDQRAFFFVGNRYIGTDAKEPSAAIRVVSQSDTEVTLDYSLYRKGDPLESPSGGEATVHFQLDNGKLTPLERIPPAGSANGLGRN